MPSLASVRGGYHTLNTGHPIPLVGFGTYKVTGDLVLPAVDAALGAGYRLFDTAKYYVNEPELGAALKVLLPKHGLTREDIFITTKFFPDPTNNTEAARRLVNESLERLNTNYLDLVLIHYPKADANTNEDPVNAVNRRETYIELEKLKGMSAFWFYRPTAEGKIRSVGVSNYEIRHIEEIKQYGSVPAVNQVEFHPHFSRNELREYCKKEGIFFQAFTSLGRQHPDLIGDENVVAIANKHNTTPQLVLLAWAVGLGVGIVPKSANPDRVRDNFRVVDLHLAQEELSALSNINRSKNYTRCDGWNVL